MCINLNDEFKLIFEDNRTILDELGCDIKIPRNHKIK
jgi:hypothetical protein